MSGRGASVAVLAEIGKAANQPFHLFEIHFDVADGGTIRFTDSPRAVSWGGNTYVAQGHFLSYSGVTESTETRVHTAQLQLSGVDQTMVAAILGKQYIDRRLLIYKAFLDASDVVLVDPFAIFDGRCDQPSMDEDPDSGKCVVTLGAADAWADFTRTIGRHTNPADQNIFFPADRGFDLVAALAGQQVSLVWGAHGAAAAVSAAIGGIWQAQDMLNAG